MDAAEELGVGRRFLEGVEVAAGPDLLDGPGSGERSWTLLACVALVPLAELLDPAGFLGTVPVLGLTEAVGLWLPVEIGGELALMVTDVLRPKQTLSLDFGVVSSRIDPPEVVSSLFSGKVGLIG